jgi:hypothetical protein
MTAKWSEWKGDELDRVKCRFGCDAPIVGIYHVPEGCWCWRDPVQALFGQHYLKAQSKGPIRALIWRPLIGPSPDV